MSDFAKFFQWGKRDNGERYCTLADNRPEWLQDAVHEAHRGDLPDDWIYEECCRAVESFDAGELADNDAIHEYADGRVDVYTKDLYGWAEKMCHTDAWSNAESEANDSGMPEETERRIAVIQYYAISAIAETMRAACEEAATENETSEAVQR